jgi:hypothetical protein
LPPDDPFFFLIKVSNPGIIIFRLSGFQADDSEFPIDLIPGLTFRFHLGAIPPCKQWSQSL